MNAQASNLFTTQFRRHLKACFTPSVALLFTAGLAQAQSIAVPNFSFENPTLAGTSPGYTHGGDGNTTVIPGWTVSDYEPNGFNNEAGIGQGDATDGTQNGYFNLFGGNTIGITTTNAVTTFLADTTYTLQVDADEPSSNANAGQLSLELFASGGLEAESLPYTLTGSYASESTGGYSLIFNTANDPGVVGQDLTIGLFSSSGGTSFDQIHLDDVRLDALTIPEPSTLALMVAAMGLLVFRLRRRTV